MQSRKTGERSACGWLLCSLLAVICIAIPAIPAQAADEGHASPSTIDFTDFSLEELLQLEVTSVSKKSKRLLATASAIHVITAEDIRRSGLTSIPEVLRLAPGLEVARESAASYSISARGFEETFANKLLVMIDGRSVYTPLFSGVYWEFQNLPLEDIDRIEVIRGPGAAIWGANAVNGVINIITRRPGETRGSLLKLGTGTEDRAAVSLRHGAALGENVSLRVSAGYLNRDDTVRSPTRRSNKDAARNATLHSRLEWTPTRSDTLMLSGGYYSGGTRSTRTFYDALFLAGTSRNFATDLWGGNANLSWRRTLSEDSSIELAGYFDVREQHSPLWGESRITSDLSFQHIFRPGSRHELIWGVGWRHMKDRIDGSNAIAIPKDADTNVIYSAFAQDEIDLVPDRVTLTFGSKLEWTDFSSWEVQPSAQLMWTPNEWNQVWASVSRSVRTPSRSDRSLSWVVSLVAPTVPLLSVGNPDFEPEVLIATEVGYRVQPSRATSFDLALFLNDYENMSQFYWITAIRLGRNNGLEAKTYGAELAAHWQPRDWLRFQGSWTGIQIQLSGVRRGQFAEGATPHHQLQLHSYLDLPGNLELDTSVYYTGRRESSTELSDTDVPSHWRLDLRLGWHPSDALELSVVAQNLTERRHAEVVPVGRRVAQIERAYFARLTWRY